MLPCVVCTFHKEGKSYLLIEKRKSRCSLERVGWWGSHEATSPRELQTQNYFWEANFQSDQLNTLLLFTTRCLNAHTTTTTMSILLTVFLVQLFLFLVKNVFKPYINDVAWLILSKLPIEQSKQARQLGDLQREVVRLKREMNATSAQDEFAKWAKLRRQHDKAKEKYDSQCTNNLPYTYPPLLPLTVVYYSTIPPILQIHLRQGPRRAHLAQHARPQLRLQHVLRQRAALLATARLGALSYRVGAVVDGRAAGECECECVGYCVCEYDSYG